MDLRHKEALLQHEELILVTDRISLIISAPRGNLSEARFRKLLDYEIGYLIETLREHFLYEESSGYLSSTFASMPGLARRVETLKAEHTQMASGLDGLKKQLPEVTIPQITARLQFLIQTLHQHEQAENELLEILLCEEHQQKS